MKVPLKSHTAEQSLMYICIYHILSSSSQVFNSSITVFLCIKKNSCVPLILICRFKCLCSSNWTKTWKPTNLMKGSTKTLEMHEHKTYLTHNVTQYVSFNTWKHIISNINATITINLYFSLIIFLLKIMLVSFKKCLPVVQNNIYINYVFP